MKLNIQGYGEILATQDNSVILKYPTDMANAMYIDLDDTYAVIHADSDAYDRVAEQAIEDGIRVVTLPEGFDDWDGFPHNYVFRSLTKFVIDSANDLLD